MRSIFDGDHGLRVVVADGGSTDGTQAIVAGLEAEFEGLSLIDNPGRLQSAGVNAVAMSAAADGADVLVRCDAHAVYPRGFVRGVAEVLAARGAASVVVPLDARGETCFARAAAAIVDTPLGSGGSAHRGGSASGWVDHGHHAGFALEWFKKIGGYDAALAVNEDADYDQRLAGAGGKVWLEASLRVDYRMRPGPSGLLRQYWRYGQGRAATTLKNCVRPRLRQVVPAANVVLLIASALLGAIHPVFFGWIALYAGLLLAASVWMCLRLKSPCGLASGVALGIMHNAWGLGFLSGILRGWRRPRQ